MSRNQGSGIPRWVTGVNVATLLVTLALVIPGQVKASHLTPPTNLCVCFRPSQTAPKLTWGDAQGQVIQGYILQRSSTSDFTSGVVEIRIAKNTFSHIDETRAFNTSFWYRIQSYVGTDRSGFSNIVRAINGPGTAPSAPAAPDDLRVTQEGSGLRIRWRNNANNETGIWVERSGDEQVTWEFRASLSIDSTTYFDNDPPAGGPFYRIWAFNSGGFGRSYSVQYVNATPSVPGVPSVPTVPTVGIPSVPGIPTLQIPPSGIPTVGIPTLGVPTVPTVGIPTLPSLPNTASIIQSIQATASAIQSSIPAVPDPNKMAVFFGIQARIGGEVSPILSVWVVPICFPNACAPPPDRTCAPLISIYEYCTKIDTDGTR